jgi:hypothetical protein
MYDHRVMDGATVARALGRMEQILNSVILDELRALPGAAAGAATANSRVMQKLAVGEN